MTEIKEDRRRHEDLTLILKYISNKCKQGYAYYNNLKKIIIENTQCFLATTDITLMIFSRKHVLQLIKFVIS